MKIFYKILTSFLVTATLSSCTQEKLFKKSLDIDLSIITECVEELSQFKECQIDKEIFRNNRDEACSSFNIDNCKSFLKEEIKHIPKCKEIPKELLEQNTVIFEIVSYHVNFACSKDENDKYCPFSDVYLDENQENITEENLMNYLIETCKSKKCKEATLDTVKKIKTYETLAEMSGFQLKHHFSNVQEVKKVKEFLESDQCVPLNITKPNNSSNDASSLIFNKIVLITIFSILTYIFI